ncbi:hypothetical protein [Methanobrevibacter sp.]|uniref:hypothetical protein n=1 Tax=Methanobrevibacter sp. TaxID=66852 RepID=UPI0025E55412|nr:hypothetical protein [Methanobrevibacter sp.]MBQ2832686.1 hypothetical protein [Methanobrevibacter sp.]
MSKGNYEIIKLSHLFDEKWYTSQYLMNKPDNPIKHFIDIGCKNNYNPSPQFDTSWYLEKNKDVKKSGMNPFVHYIEYGRKEGRLPNPTFDITKIDDYSAILHSGLFDDEWFSEYYSLKGSNTNLVRYYMDEYLNYGLNPSPNFDSIWYLEKYDDVKKNGINPFVHYVKYGKKEGRMPKWK